MLVGSKFELWLMLVLVSSLPPEQELVVWHWDIPVTWYTPPLEVYEYRVCGCTAPVVGAGSVAVNTPPWVLS
jgi:hypothetical protein